MYNGYLMNVDGIHSKLEHRLEVYLTYNPDEMFVELLQPGERPDYPTYAPGYGVGGSQFQWDSMNQVEQTRTLFNSVVMNSRQEGDITFQWETIVDEMVTPQEEFFRETESLYSRDEQNAYTIFKSDTINPSLNPENIGGATLLFDYTHNTFNADNLSGRVRLYYGVPWRPSEQQQLAITIISEYALPMTGLLGLANYAFVEDPVGRIPIDLHNDKQD